MATLTAEPRQEIERAGNGPVRLEDPETRTTYVSSFPWPPQNQSRLANCYSFLIPFALQETIEESNRVVSLARGRARHSSEFRHELFRFRAESPESLGDRVFQCGRRCNPCFGKACADAILIRRSLRDLREGHGDSATQLVGIFRSRFKVRYEQWHGGPGGSAEQSQRPGRP